MVHSVHFGPLLSISGQFYPLQSFLSKLVRFVWFCLLWSIRSTSNDLGPLWFIWSSSVYFLYFSRFVLVQSIWVQYVYFSPLWSFQSFGLFGPFRSIRKGNYDVLLQQNGCYCWVKVNSFLNFTMKMCWIII